MPVELELQRLSILERHSPLILANYRGTDTLMGLSGPGQGWNRQKLTRSVALAL